MDGLTKFHQQNFAKIIFQQSSYISDKTLVVLKGSGRASDILCYGYEHSIEVEKEVDG